MTARNDYKIAEEQYERYAYARDNGHLDFVKKADKCDEYFAGIQWDPITKAKLESQGKPVLTINKVLATLATVMGEQLSQRADISFRPLQGGSSETADALTKVYSHITNANKMDWLEAEVAGDGFVTSRGFYDVRMSFDDQMQGEVKLARLNPRNVLLDADADEYDPDTWKEVFISKWVTAEDIEYFYGKGKAKALKDLPISSGFGYDSAERFHNTFGTTQIETNDTDNYNTRRKIRVIERQYKQLRNTWHFVDRQTGDTRVVPENWNKEKRDKVAEDADLGLIKKLVQHIKWTVTADRVVLFDEWSPYTHFTVVPYFPFLRNGRTIGIVENLLSPQDQLNKASSQELHIINTTANSGWKVKEGSLRNMDVEDLEERGGETGLVIELADTKDIEKIQPNTVPTGLDRVAYKSDEAIKDISGVSDSQRGMDRADVAAKAIQAKQAAGSINLAKPLDNLARTRHMVAIRVLDLVQRYYSEERVLQVVGGGLTAKPEELTVNQITPEGKIANDLTIGEYEVMVVTVPARQSVEDSQFQEVLELRNMGVAIPDEILIEYSHLSRKAEIAEQIKNLNGGGEITKAQQQLQEIEMQAAQLENDKTKAEIESTNAKAALTVVNAKVNALKAKDESEAGPDGSAEANAAGQLRITEQTAVAQLRIQREKNAGELELAKYKIDEENRLKQEQMDNEFELKEQQIRTDADLKRSTLSQKNNQPTNKG